MGEGVVDGFEGEAPFVGAAGGVTVAAALASFALPGENVFEWVPQ